MADSNQLAALSSLKGAYTYVVKHAGVIILLPMAARLLVRVAFTPHLCSPIRLRL